MKRTAYENYCLVRDKLGYTDYKVAKETGIGTATMSNWKNGKYVPKTDKIQKIAALLGTTEKFITEGIESTENSSTTITKKDERDISKTVNDLMEKLESKDGAPLFFDGAEMSPETKILFKQQLKSLVTTVKEINKVKFNPNKNKK